MLRKFFILSLAIVLLGGIAIDYSTPVSTNAASNFEFISFDGNQVIFRYTGSTDDGGGVDYVMVVFYGANGIITDTDRTAVPVGDTVIFDDDIACTPGTGFPEDLRPCTIEIYDISSDIEENDPAALPLIFASPLLYPVNPSAQPAPQVGTISISVSQAQPVYESPSGGVVRDGGGHELWLPQDFDGNGSDTYLIISSAEIDGENWFEIWIGDAGSTVWVPAANVTVVE